MRYEHIGESPSEWFSFHNHISYLLSCLFSDFQKIIRRLFIGEYCYVYDLMFRDVNFETHHHTVFQVEVLYHEARHTLLHHFVRKRKFCAACVHEHYLETLGVFSNLTALTPGCEKAQGEYPRAIRIAVKEHQRYAPIVLKAIEIDSIGNTNQTSVMSVKW